MVAGLLRLQRVAPARFPPLYAAVQRFGTRGLADKPGKLGRAELRESSSSDESSSNMGDNGVRSPVRAPERRAQHESHGSVLSSALRRSRLPSGKARALAKASKALREQVAGTGVPERTRSRNAAAQQLAGTSWSEWPASTSSAQRIPSFLSQARAWVAAETGLDPPLRSTHLPSGDLLEAAAFATAEEYDFDALVHSQRLPDGWRWIEDNEVIYVPHWASAAVPNAPGEEHAGDVFVFRSGSYVTWGMSPERSQAFYNLVIRGPGPRVEQSPNDNIGDEAMEYVHIAEEPTRIVGDLIVLGQAPETAARDARAKMPSTPSWLALQTRLAFSQGLAASARLSVLETELSKYLASVAPIPSRLEAGGKVPLGRREVIAKLGSLLRLRQRANLDQGNFFDDPELYWENSRLESACFCDRRCGH